MSTSFEKFNLITNNELRDEGGEGPLSHDDKIGEPSIPIIKLFHITEDKSNVYMVFEKGGNTMANLCFNIKGEFVNNERVYQIQQLPFYQAMRDDVNIIKHILRDLVQAVLIMSHKNIIHSDIKPDNILMEFHESTAELINLKLCDMG
jgi:serine/threonine protein kinase